MSRPWEVEPNAQFTRRLGKTAAELGDSRTADLTIGQDERLVIIPGNMLKAAKPDIADA